MVEFRRIYPDVAVLRDTAPAELLDALGNSQTELFMFAGFEAEVLTGYALFSRAPGSESDAFLEYLYTVPGLREQGRCDALLRYSASCLVPCGVVDILSRVVLSPEHALEYHEFMTKRGFLPLSVTVRLLRYRLHELRETGVIDFVLENQAALPAIQTLQEVGDKALDVLLARQHSTGFTFDRERCDGAYSRFWLEKDEIHAALIVNREGERLRIAGAYLDDAAKKRKLFLELFCACIGAIPEDEDPDILLNVADEAIYEGMKKVFGPPEEEQLILEHMMRIGSAVHQ